MNNKKYYSIPEVARLLSLSRISVYKKVKKGLIKAEKIGRNYAIPKENLGLLIGNTLTEKDKKIIEEGVKKTINEYGKVLEMLGKE